MQFPSGEVCFGGFEIFAVGRVALAYGNEAVRRQQPGRMCGWKFAVFRSVRQVSSKEARKARGAKSPIKMGLKHLPEAQNWLRGLDLNQGPSGYEPDELPGCSTPRYGTQDASILSPCKRFS